MKRNTLIFVLICVMISCQSNKNDKKNMCNQINDSIVFKIVNETIEKDSFLFNPSYPISKIFNSYRLDTTNNDFRIGSPPGAACIINIRDFNKQFRGFANFNINDSICIASQIENSENKKIDTTKIAFKLFVNSDSLRGLLIKPSRISFYQFYYPLFNNDKTLVYIQYDHICPDECGEGKTLILKNDSGIWKIVHKEGRWIN